MCKLMEPAKWRLSKWRSAPPLGGEVGLSAPLELNGFSMLTLALTEGLLSRELWTLYVGEEARA